MGIESDIRQAYYANLRDHQIGETDGISPETADDLGFTTNIEDLQKLQANLFENTVELEPEVEKKDKTQQKVVCGDCGQIMPCQHGDGKRTFGY